MSTAATMRAAVLSGACDVTLRTVRRPDAGPGQVRIRVEGSGVCASSLPVWEGRPWFTYPSPPGEPGHEGWGVVDQIGEGVDADLLHRRVTFLSTHAFAEWDVADATGVVTIPSSLAGRACPGEALGCAVQAFDRARVAAGDVVAVVGVGFLGAAIVRLAAQGGATVVACSRRPFARHRALALGAVEALDLADVDAARGAVAAASGGRMADVVFEAGGVQRTLDLASTLCRPSARLVIAGYHQDGLRTIDLGLWNWRGLEVVNAHERDAGVCVGGMRRALDLVDQGVVDLDTLVTHTVDLDEVGRAFAWIRDRPSGFLKAVVTVN